MIINDKDLGKITIRRNAKSMQIKFSINSKGTINMSAPKYLPSFYLQYLISNSKPELKRMLAKYKPKEQLSAAEISQLDKKARRELPPRLDSLANKCGYTYNKLRFSRASTRWGSYSSRGTISLNIGLMRLPDRLIDYVLIHELAHSKYMNHSREFWSEVEKHIPNYKQLRKELHSYTPGV